jgi:hypothetical protein
MMRCFRFNRMFAISQALPRVESAQSVFVTCPVCAANGVYDIHLLSGSLRPVPDEIVSTCGNEQTAAGTAAGSKH